MKGIVETHEDEIRNEYEVFIRMIEKEFSTEAFTFLWSTDIHYIRTYPPYIPVYKKLQSMVKFTKYCHTDMIALGGDIVDGNTTLENQYRDLFDVMSLLKGADTDAFLISKGNHDDCSWYAHKNALPNTEVISNRQWYNHTHGLLGKKNLHLNPDDPDGGYYYIDYPSQKIRVINLNTSDFPYDEPSVYDEEGRFARKGYCALWVFGIREKQMRWLIDALSFAEEGWAVMLVAHNFLLPYEGLQESDVVQNGDLAWEVIQAFKEGRKGNISSKITNFELEADYDFTNNKSSEVLPMIFGHCHKDVVLKRDGIVAISSKNLLNATENAEGGWEYYIVDRTEKKIKAFRFGGESEKKEIEYE